MPIVPVEENKVGIAGLTDEKLRPADYSGSGLEALGAGLAGVGKAGAELADSLPGQDEAKRRHAELLRTDLAAKRAWNQGHEGNAALLDGFRQLKGKDARDALAPVAEAMAQNLHAVRHGHEDAHVRAIIDGTLAHRTAQDIMDLHAHADAQDAIAQAQESERVVANSAADALRHADDPARFDHAIATGENTLRRQGQLAGKPEAAIDGDIAAWRSARYVQAVHALAPSDGLGATALFERYRDQLTPADRAALEPLLHEPMAQTQAIADIDTAALAAAPFAPLTPQGDPLLADRMRTITSHFDRVVLPELMQRYGGDAARTWAATQIGTDAVDALVKQHGDGWYQALPEAARNAVAHNFALLNAGSSARTAPQDRAAVEASLAGLNDARRGYAQRELTLRTNRADQARRAAQGAAADQAYELADQLGHDFTSLAQLPARVRADLSDQTSAALQRQADANIDPHPVAPEGAVSLALRNMASTAPEAFRDLDMREYRPLVSADEYAMFQHVQRGLGSRQNDSAFAESPSLEDQVSSMAAVAARQRRVAYSVDLNEAIDDVPPDAMAGETTAKTGDAVPKGPIVAKGEGGAPMPIYIGMSPSPRLHAWLGKVASSDQYLVDTPPDFITWFRRNVPEFVRREEQNFAISTGGAVPRERALLVYQNIKHPKKFIIKTVIAEDDQGIKFYDFKTQALLPFGQLPDLQGFKLIIAEHSHPLPWFKPMGKSAARGPSNMDVTMSKLHPDVYFVITAAHTNDFINGHTNESYYFGRDVKN